MAGRAAWELLSSNTVRDREDESLTPAFIVILPTGDISLPLGWSDSGRYIAALSMHVESSLSVALSVFTISKDHPNNSEGE